MGLIRRRREAGLLQLKWRNETKPNTDGNVKQTKEIWRPVTLVCRYESVLRFPRFWSIFETAIRLRHCYKATYHAACTAVVPCAAVAYSLRTATIYSSAARSTTGYCVDTKSAMLNRTPRWAWYGQTCNIQRSCWIAKWSCSNVLSANGNRNLRCGSP